MSTSPPLSLDVAGSLPQDAARATLIGRLWVPGAGPTLVTLAGSELHDLSAVEPTCSQLLELDDPVFAIESALRGGQAPRIASYAAVLANSDEARRDPGLPWLMAPCDLQPVKASGVTFIASLLERVIEEQARGSAEKADAIRADIAGLIGQGAWSQYLEVGIGPDAEIFTKAPPMAAVGTGADVGIHPGSSWNNPEPEVVLAIDSRRRVLGATLGNDVNLRDFEGRSALLLGKAKDNNASCALAPFIRLFDRHFTVDDLRRCEISLRVEGPDGFRLEARDTLAKISRDPLDLASQVIGPNHQYPDGVMLFLGTMLAPTQDRLGPGQGFTHVVGDVVTVASPALGALVNRVRRCDEVAPWRFGLTALMRSLAARRLLD